MNQFRLVTMIVRTTPGTHNPRISVQTASNLLREIGAILPYTMYVLYAAFLFWHSIYLKSLYMVEMQTSFTLFDEGGLHFFFAQIAYGVQMITNGLDCQYDIEAKGQVQIYMKLY